jgi:ATP-binding cassette subfamily B protein
MGLLVISPVNMKNKHLHPLKRLTAYTGRYRKRVWLATLCSILNKLFDLAPPVLIGMAVDVVVAQENSLFARLGFVSVQSQLVALAVFTLIIWALESLFEYFYGVLWRNLAQDIQHDLRLDGFTRGCGGCRRVFGNR